ncbi:hypothetical protein [Streptosporangium sp. NPDC000396]|uniref:hypothetical protein n=1 Tax=Streptosporangium sp. NPDC000396 TaxID=3366185 RepID=UPI00368F0340
MTRTSTLAGVLARRAGAERVLAGPPRPPGRVPVIPRHIPAYAVAFTPAGG